VKIRAVETLIDPRHPILMWVRLHTDEGLIGLGETAGEAGAAAEALHSMLAALLIGEDPTRIEWIWDRCFRAINYRGTGGAELKALSAIDVALWDLLGKTTGQPTYVLLGGACRDKIPIYNTCGDYGAIRDRNRFLTEPGVLASELLAEGITIMKIWPFDEFAEESGGQYISPRSLAVGIERVAEIRRAVGDAMEIAIEGHGLWSLPAAIRIAHALEEFKPIWIEELTWAENPDVLVRLRKAARIPVVASERLLTRFGFRPIVESGAADIIMPDLAWSGGLTEGRKIAALASTYLLPIAPHNCGGPISHLVNAHFCASIPNLFAMETVRGFYRGFFPDLVTAVPVPDAGRLPLPQGPGLGADLQPALLARTDLVRRVTTDPSLDTVGLAKGDPWSTARF
jgi:L-alanine-DL-glutamate epimerase-like enolase superfamily enzyme